MGQPVVIYVCLECSAQLNGDYVKTHFDSIHRNEKGTPLWEHGAAIMQPTCGAD